MLICAIADLHGNLPEIPPCDVLCIAGDICPHFPERYVGDAADCFGQSKWLMGPFNDWLERIPARHVVVTPGNHDWVFQRTPSLIPQTLRWYLLIDQAVVIEGKKFYASPWQLAFYDWAYNAPEGPEGEQFLDDKFRQIPDDTDVLIVHGPPAGYGDLAPDRRRTGSESLLKHIKRVKPKLSIHGHIHCGYGEYPIPDTLILNASVLNEAYRLVNPPILKEI